MSGQATSSQATGEPKEWVDKMTAEMANKNSNYQSEDPYFRWPSSSSLTDSFCHRCGKPSGWNYYNSLPTCAWCLAELNAKPSYQIATTQNPAIQYHYTIPDSEQFFIKVKYAVEGMEPLEYIGEGVSDWVDLRSAEDISFKAGEFKLISLGVAIELPAGYEAIVAPRGSSFKKWKFLQANSIGVIDEAFKGDNDIWHYPVLATEDVEIKKNDRICQFRIIKHQPKLIFQTVDHLGNGDRSGFGSTGHE